MNQTQRNWNRSIGRGGAPAVILVFAWLAGTMLFESVHLRDHKSTNDELDNRVARLLQTWDPTIRAPGVTEQLLAGVSSQPIAPSSNTEHAVNHTEQSGNVATPVRPWTMSVQTASARLPSHRTETRPSIVRSSIQIRPVVDKTTSLGHTAGDQGGK